MIKNIALAKPNIGRNERKAALRVLKSGFLTQGPEVKSFEKEFSKFVEDRECVAVNSGTSALHLALLSLGIGPEDEVIVPSFTFAATANSVSLTGAKPIFVDIDSKTFNIDPKEIEKAITKKTKAIQVVHLYGLPANMLEISKIASRHSLLIIEDAAQAHGASINQKNVGTFGDAAAFSFYPTKNMTTGEGGMIVFKDPGAARESRLLRNQGMEIRYRNEIVGFNLRMTDVLAAVGREQLKKLPSFNKRRQENAEFYSSKIMAEMAPFIPIGYSHVFHQYTLRILTNRNEVSELLKKRGINNEIYYPVGVHELPPFISNQMLPVTELATKQVLSLPIHPMLKKRELNYIRESLLEIIGRYCV